MIVFNTLKVSELLRAWLTMPKNQQRRHVNQARQASSSCGRHRQPQVLSHTIHSSMQVCDERLGAPGGKDLLPQAEVGANTYLTLCSFDSTVPSSNSVLKCPFSRLGRSFVGSHQPSLGRLDVRCACHTYDVFAADKSLSREGLGNHVYSHCDSDVVLLSWRRLHELGSPPS